MSSTADTTRQNACGGCGTVNDASDQYCAGCGHYLWEKCPGCNAKSLIGHNFCKQCGFDLKAENERRLQQQLQKMTEAEELVVGGDLNKARRMVEPLTDLPDFRFKEIVTRAQKLKAEIQQQINHWGAKVSELPRQVEELHKAWKYHEIAQLLESVPFALLTEELRGSLLATQEKSRAADQAKRLLKEALPRKDWSAAIAELNVLRSLYPENDKYASLLAQVCERILLVANGLINKGQHAEALEALDAVPADYQSEQYRSQRESLEELIFLRKVVAASPFATPFIGAAVDRISHLTPNDKLVEQLSKRYQTVSTHKPAKDYHLYPAWMKPRAATFNSPICPATLPTGLPGVRPQSLAKSGTQFWSAFGLATQGLGLGNESANFLRPQKSGVLGRLGLKKKVAAESAWGVDIGDSNIKAICLKQVEAGYCIERALLIPISTSGNSEKQSDAPKSTLVFRALEGLFSDDAFRQIPVICNMPGCDLLARYLELPVDNPNQHETFIAQETRAHIPINLDLLSTAYAKFEPTSETSVSQRAMVLALKRNEVEARLSMMKRLNVDLAGLLPEPLAVLNAITVLNYLGELQSDSVAGTASQAILLIDVGSMRTTFEVITKFGCWYRTIDWGIDDINQSLAAGLKITRSDADKLRRNLLLCSSTVAAASSLKEACAVPKREMERSLRAAKEHLGPIDIAIPLLIGGGAYQPLLSNLLNGESL
ncbi:MAG: pilus assembly protein PilM [bacterium]|nr:pilus assembly protein PilM [bacterium]